MLFQLREYLISVNASAEGLALSVKGEPALLDRAERLRRLLHELNAKAARLLGDKSAVITRNRQDLRAFRASALAREAVGDARAAFGPDVQVSLTALGEDPELRCDRSAVRTALLSVLQNAVEACARRGTGSVSVLLRGSPQRVEIEVGDDGGGIPEELQPHLFEPFFSARAGSDGLGLGLSISRRLLERLGGTLRVKSKDGMTAVLLEVPAGEALPMIRNEDSTWAGRRGSV